MVEGVRKVMRGRKFREHVNGVMRLRVMMLLLLMMMILILIFCILSFHFFFWVGINKHLCRLD